MSEDEVHALLRRQARRAGLTSLDEPPGSAEWPELVRRISATYDESDRDRYLLERSLELSSHEMRELHTDLAAEQQLLSTVLAALSSGVLRLDQDWTIRFANPAAREMLLHRTTAPTPLFDVLRVEKLDGRPFDPAVLREFLASGELHHLHDVVLVRKDGSRFWASLSFNPLVEDDDLRGVVLSITDVSDRKLALQAADEAKVEAAAAERARAAQAVFLANMSHELRTPLNAILGYGELVTELAVERGYDDVVSDLNKVQIAGRHLLALINDILDVSRIEAGRIDLDIAPVDLEHLIGEVQDTIQPLAERNGNTIVVDLVDVGDVESDRVRLVQALLNVVGNANKFTDHGRIQIRAVGASDHVRVSVTDDGIGMSEEALARVFEPFTQADTSSTRRHGGTGLGLTITRSICEALGIEMSVESSERVGTSFDFRIPRVFFGHVAAGRSLGEPSSTGGAVALLIDDDAANHELISRALVDVGVEVLSASTGAKGLTLARAHRPDVILLEILLPDMDGWEVLSMLKSDPVTSAIPLIVVSISEGASRAFRLGAEDYLVKPVDLARLKSILSRFSAPEGPSNVLIVEDDDDLRQLLRVRIEREAKDWTVREAANGVEACDALAEELPDLVLLDLMMPEMDGFEFLQRVAATPAWHGVSVVVVTAMSLTPEQRRQLNQQVARIIEKGAQTPAEVASGVIRTLGIREETEAL